MDEQKAVHDFIAEHELLEEGMLLIGRDLITGDRTASYIPPDGDYSITTGPDYEVAHVNYFSNGTSVITVKRRVAT